MGRDDVEGQEQIVPRKVSEEIPSGDFKPLKDSSAVPLVDIDGNHHDFRKFFLQGFERLTRAVLRAVIDEEHSYD